MTSARLSKLVRAHGGECALAQGAGPAIAGVKLDSRLVERGDLFAALAGSAGDGALHVPEAVARGAAAVLCARPLESALLRGVPLWVHPAARAVAGQVAADLCGHPARGMFVAGVTGTNGKTTTAHLAGALLRAAGRRPAVIGTVGNRLADGRLLAATHTTPAAPELHELLARHRSLGGDSAVLEVSSHALEQERIAGLPISVAVYTGLSRDHLDYHGSMERYAAAKARLFDSLDAGGAAVLRCGDPYAGLMAERARARGARVITYGVAPMAASSIEEPLGAAQRKGARAGADLCAFDVRTDLEGTSLTLNGMGIIGVGLRLPLLGRFNVENALAAAVVALQSGAGPSAVAEGLAAAHPPPGRLEPVPTGGRGFYAYVDYAHTEDALRSAIGALREAQRAGAPQARGRLILVFGCGGERDRGKRAPMGRAASELADLALVTSDNPRGEDPERILDEVAAGMDSGGARTWREPDRRAAIRRALGEARPGDVVLIAGKGCESTQEVGGASLPFDDRRVAAEELP